MTIDCIKEYLKFLPCSDPCFEGEKNWETGNCLEKGKCEYINGMVYFISNNYPEYKIVKCLDIDKRDSSQPEALLRNQSGETMAIEMKRIPDPQFLKSSVEETKKKDVYECSFWKGSVDSSAKKAMEKFIKWIKEKEPNISCVKLEAYINAYFRGMNITIIPIEKDISVRDLAYQERKNFRPFLVNVMVDYSINLLNNVKLHNIQVKDLYKSVIYNNKLKISIEMTSNDNVFFQVCDTTPFSLCEHMRINEDGVLAYLREYLCSCKNKFTALNNETLTEKNILLLIHESTLSSATDFIEKCLKKLDVPESIHEIWVTDFRYRSVYDDDNEIGEEIEELEYRQIYTQ